MIKNKIITNILNDNAEYFNYSKKDISIKTGISLQCISELFSGKRLITSNISIKLDKLFELDKFQLLSYQDNANRLNQILEYKKGYNEILKYTLKKDANKLVSEESLYEEIANIMKANTIEEAKKQKNQIFKDFYKYKDKALAYFWLSLLENQHGRRKSTGSFKKSSGNSIIKRVLDIMISKLAINKRIDQLIKLLDKNGIILVNEPFIPNSSIRGTTFKRNKQRFIFMSDMSKREYAYIFTLIHELLHLYSNINEESKINIQVKNTILNYLKKYKKNHKDLEIVLSNYDWKNNTNESEWYDWAHKKTTARIAFKSNIYYLQNS